MKKRPLCTICILFLVIQAARVCFWGAGAEPSALERALVEEGQDISLEGTVYKVEEKAKVTAVYMKDNAVSAASQKFNESKTVAKAFLNLEIRRLIISLGGAIPGF